MKPIKISFIALASVILVSSCNNQTTENTESTAAETVETPAAPDMHTSQTALDWKGTYTGTLPCADCEGIETTLILNDDLTFEKKSVYKGAKGETFNDKGKFTWNSDGTVITLDVKDENQKYKVKEGSVVLLDQSGAENTGELAEHYILKKQ